MTFEERLDEMERELVRLADVQRRTIKLIEMTADGHDRLALWNERMERTQSVHAQIMAEIDDKHTGAILAIAEQHAEAMAEIEKFFNKQEEELAS